MRFLGEDTLLHDVLLTMAREFRTMAAKNSANADKFEAQGNTDGMLIYRGGAIGLETAADALSKLHVAFEEIDRQFEEDLMAVRAVLARQQT